MLVSPQLVHKGFRVLCGLSPNMRQSCWYNTNLPNLWNYLKNRVRNVIDREADVRRALKLAQQQSVKSHAFDGEMHEVQKAEVKEVAG
jgi:hypothetical protein